MNASDMPPRARLRVVAPAREPFSARHPYITEAWHIGIGVLALIGLTTTVCALAILADAVIYGVPTP